MKIFLCVDDNGGLLFNNRRQSRDKKVIEKVFDIVGESKLWITEFSQALFDEGKVCIDSELLELAAEDEFCFVENLKVAPYMDKINEIYLFKWNRKYPSDVKFDVPLNEWGMEEQTDFVGKSHEKITREIYVRRKGI